MNLRSIATILMLCQQPKRFNELRYAIWWNGATLSRHLKLLTMMGLIEQQIIFENRKPHAAYYTTETGVAVLRNLLRLDLDEQPGLSIRLGGDPG
ncbi:MAG: transcriptional regulator [Thermoproteota archaeon]